MIKIIETYKKEIAVKEQELKQLIQKMQSECKHEDIKEIIHNDDSYCGEGYYGTSYICNICGLRADTFKSERYYKSDSYLILNNAYINNKYYKQKQIE